MRLLRSAALFMALGVAMAVAFVSVFGTIF